MRDGCLEVIGIGVVLLMLGCLLSLPSNSLLVPDAPWSAVWTEFSGNVVHDPWSYWCIALGLVSLIIGIARNWGEDRT